MISKFDLNTTGTIDFNEFLSLVGDWMSNDENQIRDAFDVSFLPSLIVRASLIHGSELIGVKQHCVSCNWEWNWKHFEHTPF